MNFDKRLQQIIRECGVSQYRIAKDLGISQSTIKNYQEGKTKPNALILEQLSDYINVSYQWLLTGNGEKNKNSEADGNFKSGIRYYTTEAVAGTDEFSSTNKGGFQDVNIPGFSDCDIAINVWGNSMEPVLKSGNIIICKEWRQDYIDFGNIYLIVTKDNRMIKYLRKSPNENKVICASENKSYDPLEIDKDEILELYIVKGYISRLTV